MPIWVCRTGRNGQYEKTYFDNNCICLTREGFDFDLSKCDKADVINRIVEFNPNAALQTISNTWSQIDIFANKMNVGDFVIIPRKSSASISVAIVTGDYLFSENQKFPLNHSRNIKIIARDVDTALFPQDIKYSMRAFRTIFSIKQEERFIKELEKAAVVIDEI